MYARQFTCYSSNPHEDHDRRKALSELPATISETTTARRIILTTFRAYSTPVTDEDADDVVSDADTSHCSSWTAAQPVSYNSRPNCITQSNRGLLNCILNATTMFHLLPSLALPIHVNKAVKLARRYSVRCSLMAWSIRYRGWHKRSVRWWATDHCSPVYPQVASVRIVRWKASSIDQFHFRARRRC